MCMPRPEFKKKSFFNFNPQRIKSYFTNPPGAGTIILGALGIIAIGVGIATLPFGGIGIGLIAGGSLLTSLTLGASIINFTHDEKLRDFQRQRRTGNTEDSLQNYLIVGNDISNAPLYGSAKNQQHLDTRSKFYEAINKLNKVEQNNQVSELKVSLNQAMNDYEKNFTKKGSDKLNDIVSKMDNLAKDIDDKISPANKSGRVRAKRKVQYPTNNTEIAAALGSGSKAIKSPASSDIPPTSTRPSDNNKNINNDSEKVEPPKIDEKNTSFRPKV